MWAAGCRPCLDAWHDAFVRNDPLPMPYMATLAEFGTHATAIAWADQHLREWHACPTFGRLQPICEDCGPICSRGPEDYPEVRDADGWFAPCPGCGHKGEPQHTRTVCPEPCGLNHPVCGGCGAQIGECRTGAQG